MSEQYTYTVYRHTSPSGKIYIGITKHLNVKIRWCNGSSYVGCPIFYKAILKYGWDNIKHEILFNNLTKERAKILRFKRWDKEKEDFYLFPLWFALFLPYGTEVIGISGHKFKYAENTDLDIRFCCVVAFGIELKA